MKKILGLLAVLILSAAAFGQTQYGIVSSGGTLTGAIHGPRVNFSGATTIGVVITNGQLQLESGTITFQTGNMGGSPAANPQIGGTLAAGGSFVVTTANEGQIFSGTVVAGTTWQPVFNANGTHFYSLTGALTDAAGDTGSFQLYTTTDVSLTCFFSGTESIASLNAALTINSPQAHLRGNPPRYIIH